MSISLVLAQRVEESPAWEVGLSLGATAVALGIAGMAGVFRRESVVGPTRVAENERPSSIWMILLVGFSSYLLVIAAYGAARSAPTRASGTSQPASAPASQPVLSQEEQIILGMGANSAVIIALLVSNATARQRGLQKIGLDRTALRRLPLPGITSVAIVIPLMFVAGLATQEFWQLVHFDHPDAHPLLEAFREEPSAVLRALVVVSAIVFAPVAEELLFRGHLQTAILHTINPHADSYVMRWCAIILTSIAFAAVHQQIWMMPPIFFLSLCLGYAYERTGNLWVCILIHAMFNSINVAYFWLRLLSSGTH